MLILVQKQNQRVKVNIFQCIYLKIFEVHQLTIIYCFELTNCDIHLSIFFQSLKRLFSHARNMCQ